MLTKSRLGRQVGRDGATPVRSALTTLTRVLFLLAPLPVSAGPVFAQDCHTGLIQTLESASGQSFDGFGEELAMSRTHLAVLDSFDVAVPGHYGAVSLYRRPIAPGREWALEAMLRVEGGFPDWLLNSSLALAPGMLILGVDGDATLGGDAGAAYVFEESRSELGTWTFTQKLLAPDGGRVDSFGVSLGLHEDWLFVGAPFHKFFGRRKGAVYVFRRDGPKSMPWTFFQKLEPESLDFGDQFGSAIVVDDARVVVSAANSDPAVLSAGSLYEFLWDGREWVESQILTAPGLDVNDHLGGDLALSGGWLFASAGGDDDLGLDAGAVHVFRREAGQWQHDQKLLAETGKTGEGFGAYLAAEPGKLYVGDPFVSEVGTFAGAVYTFEFEPMTEQWLQVSRYFPPDLKEQDGLGPVAVQDGVVAAGAMKSLESGAVYLLSARPGRGVSTYCTATSGSVRDCAPALETLGAPSASQGSTFRIWSRTVPGGQNGVMLYSAGGPARPDLTSSGACLPGTSTQRKGFFWSGGTFGQCDGSFLLDWNDFVEDRDPEDSLLRTPGAVVHLQIAWFDPLVPGPLAWSDALAFQLCP